MSFIDRLRGRQKPKADPLEVYSGLRQQALSWTADRVGADVSADSVFGVIVDLGLGNANATFVSLADGTTSMYTSTGGGVIGAGDHERPAAASRALIAQVQADRDLLSRPWDDRLLKDGEARIIGLTPSGSLAAVADANALAEGNQPLSHAFFIANDVIAAVRMASGE